MEKLVSIESLRSLYSCLIVRRKPGVSTIVIPAGTCGQASGANELVRITKEELASRDLSGMVDIRVTGCHGFCEMEPSVMVEPRGTFYPRVKPEDMALIVDAVARGQVLEDLLYIDENGTHIEKQCDVPFFKHQVRTILGRNQKVDPTRILDYIENGGYLSLGKALTLGGSDRVVDEVKASGLRGRGGAGFSTGKKWEMLAAQKSDAGKVLVCNADEGDPGAYMDRSVLEGNPHSIIEGMLIGAYATGAREGVVYVRDEYPIAVKNLGIALEQARELGLLGDNILGTDFSFDIRVIRGAGAFVCGEETALIRSIEGYMGEPKQRPPFPIEKGVNGKPTCINNVETWANISVVIDYGAERYVSIGTPGNSGTKIFSLVGKIKNTGLVEVPMGTPIRDIVFTIGGGPSGDSNIKAVQTGGPSGGCIPTHLFDLPIDYDSLSKVGSIMGSGGMIVMDESTCMVDVAKYFMGFLKDESCGKCFTCRKGTQRMYELLDDITNGDGTPGHISLLQELALAVKDTTMCGLGQTSPNPVLATLRYFRDEYEAHINEKRCPANACEALMPTKCSSACPAHVNIPEYVALIGEGRYEDALDVIRRRNPLASVCGRACDHPCELSCRRGEVDQPVAIRNLKRFVADYVKDVADPPKWVGPRSGKVAIVGSGPAGLTAGYFLAQKGREVKVFEALDVPGGLLAVGIPAYRVPREPLGRDIEYIRRTGVEIETGHPVGSLDELRDAGYDAIFIAIGAHKSGQLNISGEEKDCVYDSLAFLRNVAMGKGTNLRGKVAVIGGGNAAIDAARTALRLGADSVTILYRRTREEMPALADEIEDAIHEGVKMEFLVAPIAIEGNGCVQAIRCAEMELGEVDESGRRRPVQKQGSERVIAFNHVIVAIGQSPDLRFAESDGKLIVSRGKIDTDPTTQRSGDSDIFAGGDAVNGKATIIEAIGAGQRAAQAIDVFLGGDGKLPLDRGIATSTKSEGQDEAVPRVPVPVLSPEDRIRSFDEVVGCYTPESAHCEAKRCLRCDLEKKTNQVPAGNR